jgi:hypothetical protein
MKSETKKKSKKKAKTGEKIRPPLSARKKDVELEKYALFMALPRKDRKEIFGYDTDQGFSKANSVSPQTLSEWKWIPKLWELRDKYLIHFKKRTANIIAKLADRAERTGEAFHTLTYMKLVEGYSEKSGVDLTSKGQKISGFKITIVHGPHRQNNPNSERPGKAG